jgi:SPOR domain
MIDRSTSHRVSLALLLLTTVAAGTWCKEDPQSIYSESLAKHRRQFKTVKETVKKPTQKGHKKRPVYITPNHAVTDQLDYLLACKKAASEQVKYVHGYTIQAYAGGSREEAFSVKNKLYTHYPAITPEITYDSPHYTVRLGKFLDKLEAYPVYAAIKKRVPQAIIRPIYFVNQPYIFNNDQATGQSYSVPFFLPATNGNYPSTQE